MREGSIMNPRAKDLPSQGWSRPPCREEEGEGGARQRRCIALCLFRSILHLILPSCSDTSALPSWPRELWRPFTQRGQPVPGEARLTCSCGLL